MTESAAVGASGFLGESIFLSSQAFLSGSFAALLLAVLLDYAFGEVKRFHPLIGFGGLAQRFEARLNNGAPAWRFSKGLLAWCSLLGPLTYLLIELRPTGSLQIIYDAIMVYFCLGFRSLREHTTPIAEALQNLESSADEKAEALLQVARLRTSYIVSRDTESLDDAQCARAAIESLLENGNDALFATLFWYALFGPAGAVLHRLANTLDAMWGYRTARYEWFGKVAARADDVLAWAPARLTAVSYCLCGNVIRAIRCWRVQAKTLSSPNGGPCMTAGAGSLGVILGGPCCYHGQWVAKPFFGEGLAPGAHDIGRAQQLLTRALCVWLLTIGLFYWLVGVGAGV